MTGCEVLDMKFDIGDKVVHPQQGVGYVAKLEEKQFEPNKTRLYYVILIPETTMWVPVDLITSGLRRLSVRSELEQCRQVLQSIPTPLNPDRGLLSSLITQLNQGTIAAHCEVVRDLSAHGWHKPLYGPMAEFQRVILNVLSLEWAAVEEITQVEAANEISNLLKKGRAVHDQQ
jgi:RNA polymerase-interacting CarD/CdnL/TRCF family regulator